ncbi:choline dehydrogenase [Streptomyces griseocarneus]|nr:choline dehydrogenase [Streptomyces griseocarneus]
MQPKTASRTRIAALALAAALLGAGAPAAYAAFDEQGATASSPADSASAKPVGKPYIKTELLFGTAKPNGGAPVTDKEFRAFVDSYVTPRFPAGLTLEDARGQYRDAHGVIERERSYKLTLLYPRGEAGVDSPKIEQIRKEYDKRFSQESVARIDDAELVDF